MKDIMKKLAELEATAPKITKKKILNEDSTTPPMNVSNKPASFKDVFENMAAQKPIPVVGKQGDQQQTGAGFININDTSPAGQAMQKALTDLAGQGKAQIVMPMQNQQTGQPNQAGATGQPQQGQMQMKEKDSGQRYEIMLANGKTQRFIAATPEEAKKKARGLGAKSLIKVTKDGLPKGKVEEKKLDELSPKTLASYTKKASDDLVDRAEDHSYMTAPERVPGGYTKAIARNQAKGLNRQQGISRAVDKLSGSAKVPANEGAKVDRMVKHIEKSEKKSGKSKEEAEDIAWATANKRGMLDNKNKKKVKEGDIAPTSSIDTRGAGLGAGRSMTTLEGKKKSYDAEWRAADAEDDLDSFLSGGHDVPRRTRKTPADKKKTTEGKKPDFLDLDKDGNKKESMKKAAADKKKQKVKESMNHKLSAARLEGKSHGLRGHAHHGKAYEDLEEMRAYHEGYKEGLDECYGQGVYEDSIPATVPGMASSAMSSMPTMEDEMEEGNAFTAALAKTPKGGKFSVGGKTFTDRTNYDTKVDEYAFESLDSQLNALLNESEDLNEGLSVSVSKGQQNSPDSVTITAQDAEADQLLQLVKHAGLGLFGDDQAEPSSAMSVQPSHGEPDEVGAGGVDVEVVDGNDGIMGLMQKLSGIQAAGSDDYEDEEGDEEQLHGNQSHTHEETCNECGGMMEAGHSCGSKMDEEESEDQMEFEVSEDNAPDSDEAETSADEDAEAKEDAALAGEKEEEMNESFASILERLTKLAEGSGDKPKHPEHDEKDDKDFDDAEEEVNESKESTEEKDEKAEKAGKKVAKDIEYDENHKGKDDNKAEKAGKKVTKDIEYDDKKEKIDEWANDAGKKGTDASFEQDIDFMTKVISGGLNKPKSTGQTTVPVIPGQTARMHDHQGTVSDSVDDWVKLAGIK